MYKRQGYEIYVSDDGRGVPDAQKGKIFEAFYQMPDDKVATCLLYTSAISVVQEYGGGVSPRLGTGG